MSRMGRKPIRHDDRVKVSVNGATVTVTGPRGTLDFAVPQPISVVLGKGDITVCNSTDSKDAKAKHGTVRSILNNMTIGVTDGFRRALEFQGVGYRGQLKGTSHLTMNLGYSNPVEYDVPDGLTVKMPDNTHIVLEGIDKQQIGQAAATIRGFRPPDAYKGKGIRYAGEKVSLKEGKTVG